MKLGLLRCLLYYPLGPFWETFFGELGFSLVVSPVLTKERFDQDPSRFVGDICLPVESVSGHMTALRDKVDCVFIPRLTDRHNDLYICPVCAGLPHVIGHAFPDGPPILSIQLTPLSSPSRDDVKALASYSCKPKAVPKAYASAQRRYAEMEDAWIAARRPPQVLESGSLEGTPARLHKRILLLGMPYVLSDPLTNTGLLDILARHGCDIVTPLNVAPKSAFNRVYVEGYPLYWAFAGMSVSALAMMLQEDRPDGVLYLSSFACGVDSVVVPIVQSVCRRCEDLPYLLLTVDEHAAAAHIEVRVEAFLDCIDADIRRKRAQA
jgi:predicted nucleotide-binding protein (sugar kinase/HSP70/actin superfamily)